mmetsp:Transcript_7021/g.10807  ORF Transcript_7021/g.10807 Transcript_7021/m.10807 type:complete len:81 (+) Transcript_7021:1147-1389(+)
MCSSNILSHNYCLLPRAMASEHFTGQCFAIHQLWKFKLCEALHALLPFALRQSVIHRGQMLSSTTFCFCIIDGSFIGQLQ